jgi:SAM-dependent methyltransferase
MFPPERMAAAGAEAGQVLALTGVHAGAVLGLCCGPGRHAVEFARRGLAVTGGRPLSIPARSRGNARRNGRRHRVGDGGHAAVPAHRAYHLACNIFTSFGYFADEDDDLRVLRNVHESLNEGGVLVMELLGLERLARMWRDSWCEDYPDGTTIVRRPRLRDNWRRVANEWILLKDGRARTFHFEHSLYPGRDLTNCLWRAGFAEVQLFGDLAGSVYGLDARRLVAAARKTAASRTCG